MAPRHPSFLILLFLLLVHAGARANDHPSAAEVYSASMSHADSVKAWDEAVDDENVIDQVGDITADVIYFPFEVTFDGIKEGVAWVSRNQIIAKVDDFLSADDGSWRVVPIASPTTGVGAKFKIERDPELEDPDAEIALLAGWWLYGRQTYRVDLTDWPLLGPGNGLLTGDLMVEYHVYPDEHFFGIGMDSRHNDERYYRHRRLIRRAGLNLALHRNLTLHGAGSWTRNELDESPKSPSLHFDPVIGTFSSAQAAVNMDAIDAFDMAGGRLSLEMNTADNRARPFTGWVGHLGAGHHEEVGGDTYGYRDLDVLVGKYVPIIYNRVLYLDVGGHFTEPLPDREIPFFDLAMLGGRESLRGFERGRFRGKHAVHGTVEYRFPIRNIWDRVGLDWGFFADVGKVVKADSSDWDPDGVQLGWGFSMQTWTFRGSGARLDVAFSHEGVRVYYVMGF